MKLVKTVYNVSKRLSTKTIDAGDYDTADQAIAAMLEHYKTNASEAIFTTKSRARISKRTPAVSNAAP